MKYAPHTVCKLPLRYLIKEGFIVIKMVPISDSKANLVLDMRMVPNLPINKNELDLLAKDRDFIMRYSANIRNDDNESLA